MVKEANKKYANVSSEALELYKELCEECQLKKRRTASKGIVVKPIISKEFNSRGQVDLIDMQSFKFNEHRFLMVYQDHLTKFVVLRPLTSKRAAEVAMQLLDIFLLLGAPNILQSDNGAEFTAHIITDLKDLWPECKIVHGKPRHPQSQGSVERANADIKDMVITWMRENHSKDWPVGVKFVQFEKNRSHHSGINRAPYKAMFGVDAKVGLASSSLPDELISKIDTEEHLADLANLELNANTPITDTDAEQIQTDDEQMDISEPPSVNAETCIVCQKPASNAHSCNVCKNTVHAICGKSTGVEGFGATVLCFLCDSATVIESERTCATQSMEKQASRMLNRSNKVLDEVEIGCSVVIPIPIVDRGKGDPRNIMAVVHEKSEKGYRLATKHGILLGSYTRNQFEPTDTLFLCPSDILSDNFISFRQAVKLSSICDGQGFMKCGCSGKNRCEQNRCACRKAGQMCNSRCHPNLTCKNK